MESIDRSQLGRIYSGRPPDVHSQTPPTRGEAKPQVGFRKGGPQSSLSPLILGIDPGLAGTGFAFLSGPATILSSSTLVTFRTALPASAWLRGIQLWALDCGPGSLAAVS